jgi:hypothetical protein
MSGSAHDPRRRRVSRALGVFHDAYPPYFERFLVYAHGNSEAVAEGWTATEAVDDALTDRQPDRPRRVAQTRSSSARSWMCCGRIRCAGADAPRTYDAQIDRLYESARAGFDASRDYRWSVVRVLYDEADTALERGAWKQAEERKAEALAVARRRGPRRRGGRQPPPVPGDASYSVVRTRAGHYGRALVTAWSSRRARSRATSTCVLRGANDPVAATRPVVGRRSTSSRCEREQLRDLGAVLRRCESAERGLHPRADPKDLVAGLSICSASSRSRLRSSSARRSSELPLRQAEAETHARTRARRFAVAPQPETTAVQPIFAAPAGPVEAAEVRARRASALPGSWRDFPAAWPDPADPDQVEVTGRSGWRSTSCRGLAARAQRRDVDG